MSNLQTLPTFKGRIQNHAHKQQKMQDDIDKLVERSENGTLSNLAVVIRRPWLSTRNLALSLPAAMSYENGAALGATSASDTSSCSRL